MPAVGFRSGLAQRVYDFLDVGKSPRPADCIFVLAGKQERKTYGVKMWRFGYASRLILSVDRSDSGKFVELNLDSDGGLEMLVEQTPPQKQHFLVRVDREESVCTQISMGFLQTRAEARGLAKCLREISIRSLLVVSSPMHLRRVALAFRRAFRKSGIQVTFVAVPEKLSFASRATRAEVWSEFRKYLLYRLIFL